MFDPVWRDLRYATRSLRRTPGFTAAAIITLALGIGANTAIFTLLDAVVFKPLPVQAAGELVSLYETAPGISPDAAGGTGQQLVFSYPRFQRLETALGSAGMLVAMTRSSRFMVRRPQSSQADAIPVQLVSGRYFAALGAPIARGRALTDEDTRPARHSPVAVVSDAFAQRALGGPDGALGQELIVNGLPVTVVGVTGPAFVGVWTDTGADMWLPLTLQHDVRYRANVSSYTNADRSQPWMLQDQIAWLTLVARVSAARLPAVRVSLEAANRGGVADLAAMYADRESRQQMLAHTLAVESLSRGFSGLRERFGDALFALTAMVGVVLLVTCANIANLLLARATARAREISIRTALGATRLMLIRQCLTESILLAAAGGVAGLAAGQWASRMLASNVLNTSRDLLPPVFAMDRRMLVFAVLTTGSAAILFGLFPAWRATRAHTRSGVHTNQRNGLPKSTLRSMRPLVVGQLALSFVLVLAGGLFGRTLVSFARLDVGFAPDGLVSVTLDPATSGYLREQTLALNDRVIAAVRQVPGVTSAAVSVCTLGANCSSGFQIEAGGSPTAGSVQLRNGWVGPGYFATLGIPRLSGREFTDRDIASSPRVAVVSESIARQYFPGQSAVGKRLGYQRLDVEIVGVVGDVRALSLREAPIPVVYLAVAQPSPFSPPASSLDVRVSGDAGRAMPAIREAIRRVEPGLIVDGARTMGQRMERALTRERLVAYLSWAFGVLALFLACVGLYAVLSYSVARRTREIGIRAALGARPGSLVRMIVGDATGIVVPGVLLGASAALVVGRLLDSLLFGVTALDPLTFVAAIGALTVVSFAAAYVPARRAASVDPMRSLRTE